LNIYIVPLQGIYKEALSVLAYDVKCCYERIFSVSSQFQLTVSWKSDQRQTHAYTWNQPTDSLDSWQMIG